MSSKCILQCTGYKHTFSFPHACPRRMKLWADILGLEVKNIKPRSRVCDLHFDPKHIGKMRLSIEGVPVRRETKPPMSNAANKATSQVEHKNDSGFETIYLGPNTTQARPKNCSRASQTLNTNELAESERIPSTSNEVTTYEISLHNPNEIEESSDTLEVNTMPFEPVNTTFKTPPKRTYSHGHNTYAKTPQLDITATCYCRCHKGEDEKLNLKKMIDDMKVKETEQAREINLLISKNKVSEHLLKGKVKKIAELSNLEQNLRKAIEGLNARISQMSRRQIKAATNASENSIIFARMICDRRKKYTKSEVVLANKLYAISGRCYYFMRDVLKLNLPHPTTLLRNRNILSPVPDEFILYKEGAEEQMEQDREDGTIVFSPEPMHEQHHQHDEEQTLIVE